MTPLIAPITSEEDYKCIVTLADEAFGEGYFRCENLSAESNLILGAYINGQIAGFVLCNVVDIMDVDDEYLNQLFKQGDVVYRIQTLLVRPENRGCGIATNLLKKGVEKIHQKNGNLIFAHLWQSKKGVAAAGIFNKAGFTLAGVHPMFWADDSLSRGWICCECQDIPCCCAAVTYYLKI